MAVSEANAALCAPATFQLRMWNTADWCALLFLQAKRCNIRFRVTATRSPEPMCHHVLECKACLAADIQTRYKIQRRQITGDPRDRLKNMRNESVDCGWLGVRFKPFAVPRPEASEGAGHRAQAQHPRCLPRIWREQSFEHLLRSGRQLSSRGRELLDYGHCQQRHRARPETARPVCSRLQQGSTEHGAEGRYTRTKQACSTKIDVRQTTVPRDSKVGTKQKTR
jgi:hypothetical protein